MAEPEVLHDDGARLGRRRGWLVIGTVLLLLVGLVVLRLGGSSPETSPGPTQTPEVPRTTTADVWPDDLPAGVLFLVANGLVTTTDTGTGRQTTTSVVADPVRMTLTALGDGVLVWGEGGSTERVLPGGGRPAEPARGELARGTGFLPGPDARVWAGRRDRPGALTWRLVDAAGRTSRSVEVESSTVRDGRGGLLEVGEQGVRPVYPGRAARGTPARWSPPDPTATSYAPAPTRTAASPCTRTAGDQARSCRPRSARTPTAARSRPPTASWRCARRSAGRPRSG